MKSYDFALFCLLWVFFISGPHPTLQRTIFAAIKWSFRIFSGSSICILGGNFCILPKKQDKTGKKRYDKIAEEAKRKKVASMKVKVELNKDQNLPLAVIYTDKMTEEVEQAVEFLESSVSSAPLIAQQEDRLVIIKPSDVILVRVEGGDTVIYTGKGKHFSRKRLYEVYQQLGQGFMQISKQTVVNLSYLESVEASFNGTMFLRLEHGLSDYISRKYLPNFKQYLGL